MANVRNNRAGMDLLSGSVPKTLIAFSMPFMVSTLLQTLYSTVDTIVVGQVLGSPGLSGVSNGSQIMQLIYMLCIGFSNSGQVLIAQYKGAGRSDKIQNTVGTLCILMTVLSVILGIFCIVFSDGLLIIMSTPEEAFDYARDYIIICGGGLIFTGFYNMFSAILRGMGDSRHPMIFVVIASAMNLVLDVIFVKFLSLGVAGAAWATIIGQAASVVFSIVFLVRHSEEIGFRFSFKTIRYVKEQASSMVRLGAPMSVQSAAINISFLFVSRLMNRQGVDFSAAYGAMTKLRNLPGILTQGLQLGISSMVGQNYGAGLKDRVSKICKTGMLFSGTVNAVFGLIFFLFPMACFRLFTQDENVLAFATMCVMSILVDIPGRSCMTSTGALISAQGFVKLSLAVSFLDAFAGRILLSWLLGTVFKMGPWGYLLGYSLATYMTAIPGLIYFFSGAWRKRNLLK